MRRNPSSILAAALVSAAVAPAAWAGTLKVPSDDYPTIQSAVDAAQDGDTISIGPGTYVENVSINGLAGLTLRGKGGPVLSVEGGFCIHLGSCSGVLITGLVLEGGLVGLEASGCSDLVVTKVTVRDSANYGITLVGGNADVTISKCTVENTGADGIRDVLTARLLVEKCRVANAGGTAISLSQGWPEGSADAVVTRNLVTDAGGTGIWFGGSNVEVSKNRIEGTGGLGIYNDPSTATPGALVEKNRVEGTATGGISLYGSAGKVSKNTVTDPTGTGVGVWGPDNLVEKNRVSGNADAGFAIGAPGNEVVKNTATAPTGVGFSVSSDGNALTKNVSTGAGTYGFQVSGTGNTFTGNRGSGSETFDLYDTRGEGANTYADNQFGTQQITLLP